MFRAKARWTEYGEKPTKYFFNMERRNYNRKFITELKGSNTRTVTDAKEIILHALMTNFTSEVRIYLGESLPTIANLDPKPRVKSSIKHW